MADILQGDYSTLYNSTPIEGDTAAKVGKTWLGEMIGLGDDADKLEWQRSEQAANNTFVREMLKLREENQFNSLEAQKQRDYETDMSNTAYQRAVADMKAAGLNPVLAFQQGGASTPSGSVASSGSGNTGASSGYRRVSGNGSELISLVANIVGGALRVGASVAAASTPRETHSYIHKYNH